MIIRLIKANKERFDKKISEFPIQLLFIMDCRKLYYYQQ